MDLSWGGWAVKPQFWGSLGTKELPRRDLLGKPETWL